MSYSKAGSLVVLSMLAACASNPTPPSAPPAAPATVHELAPATVAAPAAAVAPVATAAPTAEDAKRQALLKQARSMGFKPKLTNGVVMYCRNEAPLGTRFDQTVCHSEDAIADVLQRMQAQQDEMNAAHSCAGSGCTRH